MSTSRFAYPDHQPRLILGSSSASRQNLLKSITSNFRILVPNIDEKSIRSENCFEIPLLVAKAKADHLKQLINDNDILITADTIIICDNKIYEKPQNTDEVYAMLKSYNEGHELKLVTGIVVMNKTLKKESIQMTIVSFNKIPDDVINRVMHNEETYTIAGSLLHKELDMYVNNIDGEIANAFGLPLEILKEFLVEFGYKI